MTRASASEAAEAAREFPRGLAQPTSGFRFGLDALLLACFLPQGPKRLLDLGTGCGAVALGWLLRDAYGEGRAVGLDSNPEMVACARENSERIGLADRLEAVQADVADTRLARAPVHPESFDLVACNPPYREPGSGRLPRDAGRRAAMFDAANQSASLSDFVATSAYALPERGRACLVFLAERLPALLGELAARRLEPKRLRLVHPRQARPARLALVEARKNGRPGLVVEPPLFLYKGSRLTTDALAFCPFLACNPGQTQGEDRP